jgi:nitrogen-specific signal transduction histidine kinase
MAISLIIAALLSITLYFLLRQKEISTRTEQTVRRIISHEIRTPLSGILGVMHLLKRTSLDRNQERYVDTATNSANLLLTSPERRSAHTRGHRARCSSPTAG